MRTVSALVMLGLIMAVTQIPAADLKLFEAVQKRDQKAVLELIKNGSDVNAQRSDGSTALIWAANRDDAEIVTALLRGGAKVNVADENG